MDEVNNPNEVTTNQTENENTSTDINTNNTKTFSEEEVNNIVKKRLARQIKEYEQKLEEEKQKASMTETEKLKVQIEDVNKKANEKIQLANDKLLKAEFKSIAIEKNIVDSDVAFMLVDKTDLINDDGEIDVKELNNQIDKIVTEKPYLLKSSQSIPTLPSNPSMKTNTVISSKEQLKGLSPEQINKLYDAGALNQLLKGK